MNHISKKSIFFWPCSILFTLNLISPNSNSSYIPLRKPKSWKLKKISQTINLELHLQSQNLKRLYFFVRSPKRFEWLYTKPLGAIYLFTLFIFFSPNLYSQHPYISYQFHTVFPWSQGAVTSKVVYFFITWPIVGARGRIRVIVLKVLHKPCSHVLPV